MRYSAGQLVDLATELLVAAGMEALKAKVVAEMLVEADLMGHDTHGLQLLPAYVGELESGDMAGSGEPAIVTDNGPTALWDGHWLSGVWLAAAAVEAAADKAMQYGIGAISVRRAHHTACLDVYLTRATDRGLMAIIASSDPRSSSVAPFGGIDPVLCPDPIAIGIPTRRDPVLVDTSASITTNGAVARSRAEGRKLRGKWLQDGNGSPSDDPSTLTATPPGSLLLAGGQDHGQKGYGTALMVEALTNGLSGYGRHNLEPRWAASFYVQVINPAFFGGEAAFREEAALLADRCRSSRPLPGHPPVRVPGDRARQSKAAALRQGVELYPGIMDRLRHLAASRNIAVPDPI